MISFRNGGSTKNLEKFLAAMQKLDIDSLLELYAQEGVRALAEATPKDSGLAAKSWGYHISRNSRFTRITWTNSDVEKGFPVVIRLQYGYATGTGGYISGRDYINPAIRPIFDRIAQNVWKAVTSS